MTTNFALHIDLRGLQRFGEIVKQLSPENMARVRQRAIGTLRRRVGVEAARLLGEDLNIAKSSIKNRINVSSGDDYVSISASNKGIPLVQFAGRYGGPKTAGATAQIFKDGARKTYKSSFISKSGNIVARAWIGGRVGGKRYGRMPVRVLHGPSIGGLLIDTGPRQVAGPLEVFAKKILSAELERLFKVELK